MSDRSLEGGLIGMAVTLCVFIPLVFLLNEIGKGHLNEFKKEALNRGYGEYTHNEMGEPIFTWKVENESP